MNSPRELFEQYCGPKFEKFMAAIYVNHQGKVELKFWQAKLVTSFLSKHTDLDLNADELLSLIHDGTELMYKCPEKQCWGDVHYDRKVKTWGCGECGRAWKSLAALKETIQEGEARDLCERSNCFEM
ncbi:hypothetical protein [Prosthecobacter sp.]|uniref:hypothetical protein n=1 Tax=Prosthecobacter sp. TaxID=1965333 RepID=UPI003784CF68